jgi:O-succinylbenzoate synthase
LQDVNYTTDVATVSCLMNLDMLWYAAMRDGLDIAAVPSVFASTSEVAVERVGIRLVRLPLKEAFETSFGRINSRLIFLITVEGGGLTGWGEVVAAEEPRYSYETIGTASHVIRDFLAQALMAKPVTSLADVARRFAPFKGHNMAKAGLELAYMDLLARMQNKSLAELVGGTRKRVPVGVSLGIQPTLASLLERVDHYLALGYQRIKLKIMPGWDLEVVAEVRRRHPNILLSVDANSAYTLNNIDHLKALDDFDLLMIEQPLGHDDLLDHAKLQAELKTSICLDESITTLRRAEHAIQLGSCRLINIKIGRVGGYSQALPIHDLCYRRAIPVWCGGMLESGIGRAHNLALASLPGFTLPGDISASSRYFHRDLISPAVEVASDGTAEVPAGPGLGFEVDLSYIESCTTTAEQISRKN